MAENLEVSFFLFIFAPIILKTLTMNKMPLNHNLLVINVIGGCIDFAVTSSFTYRYRAFRRCQMMAQAEGSLRLFESTSVRL